MHEKFEAVVKEGRGAKLKTNSVSILSTDFDGKKIVRHQEEPLNGRVYLAEQAMEFGLVDEIGYLDDATSAAAELAGLDEPKVVQYSRRKTFREQMGFSDMPKGIDTAVLQQFLSPQIMMLWQGQ